MSRALRIGASGNNVRLAIPGDDKAAIAAFSPRRARIYAARLMAAAEAVESTRDPKVSK